MRLHDWETFDVIVGSAGAALLFIGIHNAWDSVVYIATRQHEP